MKKALSLVTLSLFVLGLAACSRSNDITGINSAASAAGSETLAKVTTLADGPHKVVVQAPNRPVLPRIRGETPTPTPTPYLRSAAPRQAYSDDRGARVRE